MNLAHVHLVLNHLPIVGIPFVLLLYATGEIRKSNEIKRVAYYFAVGVALLTIPTYFTGEPAEKLVEHLPGVSEALIERHEDAAQISLVLVLISGALACLKLFITEGRLVRWINFGFLFALLGSIGILAYTANRGGEIRHTEIRANANDHQLQEKDKDHDD